MLDIKGAFRCKLNERQLFGVDKSAAWMTETGRKRSIDDFHAPYRSWYLMRLGNT